MLIVDQVQIINNNCLLHLFGPLTICLRICARLFIRTKIIDNFVNNRRIDGYLTYLCGFFAIELVKFFIRLIKNLGCYPSHFTFLFTLLLLRLFIFMYSDALRQKSYSTEQLIKLQFRGVKANNILDTSPFFSQIDVYLHNNKHIILNKNVGCIRCA